MSITSHTSPISPLLGQEDQSARLAASAEVGQVEGTTLEQFQRWLETRAHEALHAQWPGQSANQSQADHEFCCNAMIHCCRHATALLMLFKLEQGA